MREVIEIEIPVAQNEKLHNDAISIEGIVAASDGRCYLPFSASLETLKLEPGDTLIVTFKKKKEKHTMRDD